jgi:hypothetical protein
MIDIPFGSCGRQGRDTNAAGERVVRDPDPRWFRLIRTRLPFLLYLLDQP